jgi:hypothetical protein
MFGAEIFKNYKDGKNKRIIFKYSSGSSMILKYEEQYLTGNKKWNPAKKQFDSESQKKYMIVADYLAPVEPRFEGMFEYYVPSSDIYQGFIFERGCWTYYKEVDVRNLNP